jgi:hypothetical protein
VIKDRRVFSQEEPEKKDSMDNASDKPKAAEETRSPESEDRRPADDAQTQAPLPEINFSTFIMSLNASALVNLGLIDDPASGTKSMNLPIAKQTIDIMSMLEERTRGNLNEDEAEMIKSILYELRMLYIKENG